MQVILKEIVRQSNKISKILTKISERYVDISSEVDLALYAALKIQKIVNKYMQSCSSSQIFETNNQETKTVINKRHNFQPLFDAALKNIQSFKQSTSKLQSKINILINQSEAKFNTSKQGGQIIVDRPYRKIGRNRKIVQDIGVNECQRNEVEEQASKTISEMDQSILKISNQLLTFLQKDNFEQIERKKDMNNIRKKY